MVGINMQTLPEILKVFPSYCETKQEFEPYFFIAQGLMKYSVTEGLQEQDLTAFKLAQLALELRTDDGNNNNTYQSLKKENALNEVFAGAYSNGSADALRDYGNKSNAGEIIFESGDTALAENTTRFNLIDNAIGSMLEGGDPEAIDAKVATVASMILGGINEFGVPGSERVVKLEGQLKIAADEALSLKAQLLTTTTEKDNAAQAHKSELVKTQAELKAEQEKCKPLQDEVAAAQNDLHEQKANVARLQDELAKVNPDLATAQAKVLTLEGELKIANEELVKVQSELNTEKANFARLEGDLNIAKDELAKVNPDLIAAQAKALTLEGDLKIAQDELAKVNPDLTTAQAKVLKLEANLKTAQDELKVAQDELAKVNPDLTTAQAKVLKLEADLKVAQDELAKASSSTSKISALGAQIAGLKSMITVMETTVSTS
jgi:predicted  nucleic acid-binding Zn-ribbon protein